MPGTDASDPSRTEKKMRVFVSYDREHDGDLYGELVAQASKGFSGFEICARSAPRPTADAWDDDLRRELRGADEVIVLCGEHSEGSDRMAAELRIAQEEKRPYLLLWGRRDSMCTKPSSAKPTDSMFSWTWEILQRQRVIHRRVAESQERAAERQRVKDEKNQA